MARYKISLDKNSNPAFYNLANEYNSLMDRWNIYNQKLHKFRIPRILLFRTKNKLIAIGKEIANLQKDFLDWQGRARNFFLEPHYKIDPEQKGDLIFMHFTDTMRYLVNHLDSNMMLLAENYNKVYSSYENRISFLIAIIAFIVSFTGLILGIVTFVR